MFMVVGHFHPSNTINELTQRYASSFSNRVYSCLTSNIRLGCKYLTGIFI
jgi:hypothetical protein